jgi:hypothetical protein
MAGLACPVPGFPQRADFTIAWTNIGEVASQAPEAATKVQRDTRIVRVDVQPTIVEVAVGKQICMSSFQVHAFAADGKPVAGVPLSISVREDHRPQLQLTHLQGICMRPARSGEYPIRLTSKVPAADDTLRGAQVFLRAG